MDELLEDLIDVLMDAQDALRGEDEYIWIDGYGYPIAEEGQE